MATGSISDTPPTGPSVPPGTPLSDILDLISTSQAAYNAALLTYNNAKDTYTAFVNDANAKYLAYQQTPTQQTLDDYTAAVTALAAPTLAWQLAVVELNSASTTYVTNLAYQQIYYAQTSDSTITTALTSILGQSVPSSTPLGQRIPVFPWLSSSQIDALTAIAVTNAPATQLKTVLHNLLTAFLNYRNIYWRLASDNDSLAHLDANRTAAYHDLNLAIAGVSGYDLTDCQTAYDTAQFQYDTMHTQLTTDLGTALTLSTALNSSISAYEATYEAVKNLGTPLPALDLTVQTVIAFCANWTENVVHAAQTAVSTALQDAMNALVFANQELVANFNADYAASHPGLSPESITQILSQLAAVQAALTTAGVYLVESITTPTLPASSSSMSMMELMGILGQAELTSEEVIRRAADSEHQITAMRLQFAISHLMLFANELAALQDWSNELIAAQIDFNAQIEINNGQTYDSLVATYTTYQNNISVINGVIDQVNQEIEAENARGQALVDAANAMDPASVSAIFSERMD